jgi:hypothetical protein
MLRTAASPSMGIIMSYGRILGAALIAPLLIIPARTAGAAEIEISKVTITTHTDADAAERPFRRLERRLDRKFLYIDWIIKTGSAGQSEEACRKALDESMKSPDQTITVPAFGYTRALIKVRPGDPKSFPLNAANCQYRTVPVAGYDLRIRGLYYVLKTEIPTANEYRLRPVNGDLDDIAQLRRTGAFADE